ncbi:methyltransferase domain-containing protein [Szabonella alba]|uniref:Methyltransferase domain-containing protein n=1 Tax=Szabonella alba TaxID=2804194 RepID=A0A8K0V7V5_9RHOB|nr:methyltransferase domain-containing protein [Szabonella alba]
MTAPDWNPESYARYADLRLRPATDLLAQVGALPPGDLVDLGCGTGAAAAALRARYLDRALLGLDASSAMLERAAETGAYVALIEADLRDWAPERPPALIFSNAALQWLGDHAALMPRLAAMLAPGGVLAVQMPRQWGAPSHRFLRDIAAAHFPGRFEPDSSSPVATAAEYWRMLSGLGRIKAWETDYVQYLGPVTEGHPVRHFTQSTAMRPVAERLDAAELAQFLTAYDTALAAAYPILPDGGALMPFRRVFFVLEV